MSRLQKHLTDGDGPRIYTSDNLSLAVPDDVDYHVRPPAIKHVSLPTYHSPLRHHRRIPSSTRQVKETLNARSEYSNSEDDGTAQHRINQYTIKQEIGRGSFGAVFRAADQYGQEYAIKEFSKSRLRKRAQSNLLRRPKTTTRGQFARGMGFNSPLHYHRHSPTISDAENQSIDLIKEEIAIMKKLDHPNLVSLFEVLDDPDEDSLYMVLEMCKKGVSMHVGLEERADPYDEEQCRCWFRDMILGIEYLHAQGIIHRDIKPDNCLITDDDVLKIVDFGVSEMFEKADNMNTAKSAGSPAFMPPELCVAKHGQVSGKAADIWSMGVTLYCLRFGRIPFEKTNVLELYDAIRGDPLDVGEEQNDDFKDLILRTLEKDPAKRITMDEIREHPWVTKRGADPLLSKDENTAHPVEPPTEAEMSTAITGNMKHLMVVMKAAKRFKRLVSRKRPELMEGIFGRASRFVQPPQSMDLSHRLHHSQSLDADDRAPLERVLTTEGVHRVIPDSKGLGISSSSPIIKESEASPEKVKSPVDSGTHLAPQTPKMHNSGSSTDSETRRETGKGQAHNPLEDTLFLGVGTGDDYQPGDDSQPAMSDVQIVCESPGAVDVNVYEAAYQEEVQRILAERDKKPTLYLTRRVEGNKTIMENEHLIGHSHDTPETPKLGFARVLDKARQQARQDVAKGKEPSEQT